MRVFAFLFIAAGMAGCATGASVAADAAASSNPGVGAGSSGENAPAFNVTPLTKFVCLESAERSPGLFDNSYTRVTVRTVFNTDHGESGVLKYPEREARDFVLSKRYDLSLTVKVKSGFYEETIPLATITTSKGKDGVAAERSLVGDVRTGPWFMIRPGSGFRTSFSLLASETLDSSLAGTSLQVALSALRAVSPEADVITMLSAGPAKAKANAIDTVVGKLFSKSISEGHQSDINLNGWIENEWCTITLSVPKSDGKWNDHLGVAGKWVINLAKPKPSIFSSIGWCDVVGSGGQAGAGGSGMASAGCINRSSKNVDEELAKIIDTVDYGAVLSYPLLADKNGVAITIKDFIAKQDNFARMLAAFGGQLDSRRYQAGSVCNFINSLMQDQGLNYIDARVVTAAVINNMQFPMTVASNRKAIFSEQPLCPALTGNENSAPETVQSKKTGK